MKKNRIPHISAALACGSGLGPHILAALACGVGLLGGACFGSGEKHSETRVVVLGIDGLDPEMLQERIDRGLCPNFAELIEEGSFTPLQTSWPPQSPVAWSNFITGCNPGKHGLYDFIHVDRHNYGFKTSMTYTDPIGLELCLFGYKIPVTGGAQHLTRAFPAFWEVLDEAGVPVAVHRIPANFPPEPTEAVTFPDMGTPDLVGAASGKSHLWTESPERTKASGESYYIEPVVVSRVREGQAKVEARFHGPPNEGLCALDDMRTELETAREQGDLDRVRTLNKEIADKSSTFATFTAYVDLTSEVPQLAVDVDGHWAVAAEGEWTDWVPVSFELIPMIGVVGGQTRFLFKNADPFELYAAPIQIDPAEPIAPVSTPEDASEELAQAIGPYYTQGFPDAYKAYKADLLTTAEFVDQSDTVLEERKQMMRYALDEFDRTGGLLFFYYGSLDMRCHMLWHAQDEQHPHREDDAADYEGQIDRIYAQMDEVLGELRPRLTPDTELLVISDHGFAPFRRKMHVTDWLLEEGYLVLREGVDLPAETRVPGDPEAPEWDAADVDWSKSRAYCIGFNGIILNREGREPHGIVSDAEADALLDEIAGKLMQLRDGGQPVFTKVVKATDVFTGDMLPEAPDLQLGFNVGFGASDECAVGQITGEGVIVDNDSRWSGSHLMDPELVKGTLIVGAKRALREDPRLEDVTATLYRHFNVEPPSEQNGIDGVSLYEIQIN